MRDHHLRERLVAREREAARAAAGVRHAHQLEEGDHVLVEHDLVLELLEQVEDQLGLELLERGAQRAQLIVHAELAHLVAEQAQRLGDVDLALDAVDLRRRRGPSATQAARSRGASARARAACGSRGRLGTRRAATSWRRAAPAQSRFAAGLAGLGWRIPPSATPLPASASRARASAKRPMPITCAGWSSATSRRSCSSQARNSGSRSRAGSWSGVRFLPLASMNTQGAVVGDEGAPEEALGLLVVRADRAPEPRARHLAAPAGEALDRALRVLARRLLDRRLDAEPVAHVRDLAEGHARLRHAEGARVHAEEEHRRSGARA